jgi:hypothetical protein
MNDKARHDAATAQVQSLSRRMGRDILFTSTWTALFAMLALQFLIMAWMTR